MKSADHTASRRFFNMPDARSLYTCSLPPDTRTQSSGVAECIYGETMHFLSLTPTDDDNDNELPDLVLDMPGLVPFAESNSQLDKSRSKGQVCCD
jgi:hypothetical protein